MALEVMAHGSFYPEHDVLSQTFLSQAVNIHSVNIPIFMLMVKCHIAMGGYEITQALPIQAHNPYLHYCSTSVVCTYRGTCVFSKKKMFLVRLLWRSWCI